MTRRWIYCTAYIALAVVLLSGVVWADTQPTGKAGAFPGGHLKFSYRTETGSAGMAETTTTEITPTGDGRYQVVTTTTQSSSKDEIRLSFFGISLKWLGLYRSNDTGGTLDITPLDAFATMVLEPHKTYMLPDGGKLQTGDRVTIAGLSGIEGVYTRADVTGVAITVVLADDLFVRQFLPFPLRVELQYTQPADTTSGEGSPIQSTYVSGTIELVEYTWIHDEGDTP